MARFRYRTATLLGPWRETADAAVADAIRAKQARRDEDDEGWRWVVPGAIEEHAQIGDAEREGDSNVGALARRRA